MFRFRRQLQITTATRLASRDAIRAWTKLKKARAPGPIVHVVGEPREQNAGLNAELELRRVPTSDIRSCTRLASRAAGRGSRVWGSSRSGRSSAKSREGRGAASGCSSRICRAARTARRAWASSSSRPGSCNSGGRRSRMHSHPFLPPRRRVRLRSSPRGSGSAGASPSQKSTASPSRIEMFAPSVRFLEPRLGRRRGQHRGRVVFDVDRFERNRPVERHRLVE